MGEERGSSGSSTAMIVMAILGGILLVGCCGGVVVLGLGSMMWVGTNAPMEVRTQVIDPIPMPQQLSPEVTKALDDLNKEKEPLMIEPEAPSSPDLKVPESEPAPAEPPVDGEKD
jgi:hypothetical protein